jgi:hypothetical protein
MENSSFETLEKLAAHLIKEVSSHLSRRLDKDVHLDEKVPIRVCLEKPTAVPFAACPEVEMRTG